MFGDGAALSEAFTFDVVELNETFWNELSKLFYTFFIFLLPTYRFP